MPNATSIGIDCENAFILTFPYIYNTPAPSHYANIIYTYRSLWVQLKIVLLQKTCKTNLALQKSKTHSHTYPGSTAKWHKSTWMSGFSSFFAETNVNKKALPLNIIRVYSS